MTDAPNHTLPAFAAMTDLASERMGAEAIACNDDFFAGVENLTLATTPVFIEGKYTEHGKWMDGWETRRRRTPGYDWAIVRLGQRGVLHGVDVDTAHFLGNYPEHCSLEACDAPGADAAQVANVEWWEIIPKRPLIGGSHNHFGVTSRRPMTHVRLNIYPDGGVARLHAFGEVCRDWQQLREQGQAIDLAGAAMGGRVLGCNDEFFCHKDNLILPGDARNMGDGWETRRRRVPGNDWIVMRLAHPGTLVEAIVDTMHYKGNFPESCMLRGARIEGDDADARALAEDGGDVEWRELLPRTPLSADNQHRLTIGQPDAEQVFTHVRLDIFPDGGVARLRLFGLPDPASRAPAELLADAAPAAAAAPVGADAAAEAVDA